MTDLYLSGAGTTASVEVGKVHVGEVRRIPASYQTATLRNTTPVDIAHGEVGVGFDLPDGTVIRLRLDFQHAKHLCESIASSLMAHGVRIDSGKPA